MVEKPDGSLVFVPTGEKRETKVDKSEEGEIEESLTVEQVERDQAKEVAHALKDVIERNQ